MAKKCDHIVRAVCVRGPFRRCRATQRMRCCEWFKSQRKITNNATYAFGVGFVASAREVRHSGHERRHSAGRTACAIVRTTVERGGYGHKAAGAASLWLWHGEWGKPNCAIPTATYFEGM